MAQRKLHYQALNAQVVLVGRINKLLALGFVYNKKNIEYDRACPSNECQWSLQFALVPAWFNGSTVRVARPTNQFLEDKW